MRKAPAHERTLAWILDAVFAGLVIVPFLVVMFAVGDFSEGNFDAVAFCAIAVPAFVTVVSLAAFLDGERNGTPGKLLLGIRWVNRETGERLGFFRAAVALVSLRLAGAAAVKNEAIDR